MDSPPPPRLRTLGLRLLAVLLFAAWIWQGPIRRVVFESREPATWSWRMFASAGKKSCDVRYYRRQGLQDTYIERWTLFGKDSPLQMPRAIRLVHPKSLDSHAREVCRLAKQLDPLTPLDIRAEIRCPYRLSWRVIEARERDICHSSSKAEVKAQRKRKRKRAKKRSRAKAAATASDSKRKKREAKP